MPTWDPTLIEVAGCIPTRTVNVNLPGSEEYLNTFNSDTRPTAAQAQEKIDAAVSSVLRAVSSVGVDLEDVASSAAKWRAAADIELSYPRRNADADYYQELNDRAKWEWGLLLAAADTQNTGTESAYPTWYTTDAPWWADRTDI